jgi:hypothetical protein
MTTVTDEELETLSDWVRWIRSHPEDAPWTPKHGWIRRTDYCDYCQRLVGADWHYTDHGECPYCGAPPYLLNREER